MKLGKKITLQPWASQIISGTDLTFTSAVHKGFEGKDVDANLMTCYIFLAMIHDPTFCAFSQAESDFLDLPPGRSMGIWRDLMCRKHVEKKVYEWGEKRAY